MPLRALLLDDRDDVAEVLAELLRDLGYATVWANTVQQALAELDNAPAPDAVLADYWLPDGPACGWLRKPRIAASRSVSSPAMPRWRIACGRRTCR